MGGPIGANCLRCARGVEHRQASELMTKQEAPSLTVWDRPRNTIREFAEALAAAKGALSADVIEQEILNDLWRGEYDGCISCPGLGPPSRAKRPRSYSGSDRHAPKSFAPITREELRDTEFGVTNWGLPKKPKPPP